MSRSGQGRVVVGVDGSPQSLAALREAVGQARRRRAELHVVHVRRPASPKSNMYYFDAEGTAYGLTASQKVLARENFLLDRDALALIEDCFDRAVGGTPRDILVTKIVLVGRPVKALVRQAWQAGDLIVVGTRGSRRWRHPLRRSVSRYCAVHAQCGVLVSSGKASMAAPRQLRGADATEVAADVSRESETLTSASA